MRKSLVLAVGVCFCALGFAQDQTMKPPKVLVIMRENLKPGKAGTTHEKSESAFVNAFRSAKWPEHYLAMDSQSGASRALFFVGYDSFAAWEKDTLDTAKNAALSAALDRAQIADGELLTGYESSAFVFLPEQSYNVDLNIAQMQYMEISRFHVRPGHDKEWSDLAKLYVENYGKAVPDAHWALYQEQYGQGGDVVLVITPMKSLAEVDKESADYKKFSDLMGPDKMKTLSDMFASAVDIAQTNLFAFNPRESYAPDTWVKADPSFWKP